jgi:hypothetical protein
LLRRSPPWLAGELPSAAARRGVRPWRAPTRPSAPPRISQHRCFFRRCGFGREARKGKRKREWGGKKIEKNQRRLKVIIACCHFAWGPSMLLTSASTHYCGLRERESVGEVDREQ